MNTTSTTLRATWSGTSYAWHGVVKDAAGKVVARCEHSHRNRHSGSRYAGPSAMECATKMLRELTPEADHRPEYMKRMHP